MIFNEKIKFLVMNVVVLLGTGGMSSGLYAATHYVRAGASGSGSGSDWSNAYAALPGTLTRGDTYFVAAGSYPSHTFNDNVSGAALITIQHPTSSTHGTDVGWQDSYAGQAVFPQLTFNKSYYNLDGVSGGGPGSWETGFGFKIQMPTSTGQSAAVYTGSGVGNISLRHVDIQGRGRTYAGGTTDLVYIVNTYTNVTISYCFLHDTDRTMLLTWPANGSSGMTIEYSKFARNGTAEHREAWSAGPESNVIVRNNLFEDILGTGVIAIVNNNGVANNWDIYGNVFYWTGKYADGIINTGVIMNRYDSSCGGSAICVQATNWHIYNNVIANIANGSFTSAIAPEGPTVNYVVENNMWYNNRTQSSGVSGATTADYNWFYGNSVNAASGPHDVIGNANPFVNWQAGDWRPISHFSGIALAAPYNVDPLGTIRGGDGSWDRGAYQFTGALPAAPTGLAATVK